MPYELGQTVFLSSLVLYGLVEHKSFTTDLSTNFNFVFGYSILTEVSTSDQSAIVLWL